MGVWDNKVGLLSSLVFSILSDAKHRLQWFRGNIQDNFIITKAKFKDMKGDEIKIQKEKENVRTIRRSVICRL